jgi:hypothetical protein
MYSEAKAFCQGHTLSQSMTEEALEAGCTQVVLNNLYNKINEQRAASDSTRRTTDSAPESTKSIFQVRMLLLYYYQFKVNCHCIRCLTLPVAVACGVVVMNIVLHMELISEFVCIKLILILFNKIGCALFPSLCLVFIPGVSSSKQRKDLCHYFRWSAP